MATDIDPEDRVTYAEAVAITGRSRRYLAQLAQDGPLTRMGGTPQTVFATWLSRAECEELALQQYRRGRTGDYWLTIAQAAERLGIARQNVHLAIRVGRLPGSRTAMGDWLVRRRDVSPPMERQCETKPATV